MKIQIEKVLAGHQKKAQSWASRIAEVNQKYHRILAEEDMEGEDQETTPAEKGNASPNEEQEEREQEADEEDEEERARNNKKPQKHSSRRRKDKANKQNEAEDKDNGTNTEQSLPVLSEEEISKLDAAALECDIGMPAI